MFYEVLEFPSSFAAEEWNGETPWSRLEDGAVAAAYTVTTHWSDSDSSMQVMGPLAEVNSQTDHFTLIQQNSKCLKNIFSPLTDIKLWEERP